MYEEVKPNLRSKWNAGLSSRDFHLAKEALDYHIIAVSFRVNVNNKDDMSMFTRSELLEAFSGIR